MKRLREFEWETVAGLLAAVTALVLHLLHVTDEATLLFIVLVILALMTLRDLRRQNREERVDERLDRTEAVLREVRDAVHVPDVVLVGPARLRVESQQFARRAHGDMTWFNVCLSMFEPQALFDAMLRPAIENEQVTSLQFILDPKDRHRWDSAVLPKVAACRGSEKVREPIWRDLDETVSCIIEDGVDGRGSALLSFWGEPFMARGPHDVPRYIFRVLPESELLARLREIERAYRLRSP
ncbi:MAG: hypothetical protein Kow0010_11610 [Dehalococcoidia bacterium]